MFAEHANILKESVVVNGHVVSSSGGTVGGLGVHSQLAASGPLSHVVFHAPTPRRISFWTLQGRETLLFLAVAGGLIGFAAWWTQRRTF